MDYLKHEYDIKYTLTIELTPSFDELMEKVFLFNNAFVYEKKYTKPVADNMFILLSVSILKIYYGIYLFIYYYSFYFKSSTLSIWN